MDVREALKAALRDTLNVFLWPARIAGILALAMLAITPSIIGLLAVLLVMLAAMKYLGWWTP